MNLLLENNGIEIISRNLADLREKYFADVNNDLLSETFVEIITLTKRIFNNSKDEAVALALIESSIPETLQLLLGSKHDILLHCVLELLLTMVDQKKFMGPKAGAVVRALEQLYTVDRLLKILDDF